MTFEKAAAVPLGGLNALHFLRLADVQPGAYADSGARATACSSRSAAVSPYRPGPT